MAEDKKKTSYIEYSNIHGDKGVIQVEPDLFCAIPDCQELHDDWPDDTTDTRSMLCQEHWEEQCSKYWWSAVLAANDYIALKGTEEQ